MILDTQDLLLLRLAGEYRQIPLHSLSILGFASLRDAAARLTAAELLSIPRGGSYFRLAPKGCELMSRLGRPQEPSTRRTYEGDPTLRRRLNIGSVMLTCLRAGIDTALDGVDGLREQPAFYPAFALRNGGTNLMNAASCAGFAHLGDAAYMLQYVGADSRGMYLDNELRQLHNMSSVFGENLNIPKAVIFAGDSYAHLYERVHTAILPPKQSRHGYTDYAEVYRLADIPIHLLPCDEAGAFQLAVMSETEYIAKLARAAFGDRWKPADPDIPEADGSVSGTPLVIGVDMNVRRVEAVLAAAKNLGRREVMVAALKEQMRDFYLAALPKGKFVTPLGIGEDVLEVAFGKRLTLYTPPRDPARDESGAFVYA
ncbi:MAG: hypothetical protein LBN30_03375 [Oscillospiraceae bacterium]|jgi:hypothetical protein|nr:hypothetical protein [Oscillospiraceae bacterium]